ncbi:MAG: 30S ribosomal protein S17 [Opitutia bacterium Tous-C1TDCM]|nr:MAG: 30S ribosomal protein S17 [Opitutae bacterium Tous-C1TDCM]
MSTATPGQRTTRKTQIGFVSSRSGDKSIKVTIAYKTPHPLYHKVVNRQTVLHVHDEKNETKVGDKVEVMETRPISRLKRWRVTSVIQKAVVADGAAISESDVAATVPTKTTKSTEAAAPAPAPKA